ncbi:MAG: tetratricopeptide repeat protein [Cryomorphaceae bacterium]|nr:tetratricopeptide repeat protein [Cryomorphaceae bacterium]
MFSIVCILCLGVTFAGAQTADTIEVAEQVKSADLSPEDLLRKGNAHYETGEYGSAEKKYLAVLDAGYFSPTLYYNLGNTYYKLKNVGKAILFYERALRLAPKDDDIAFNLQFARSAAIDKIEEKEEFWFKRFYRGFLQMFSTNTWAIISLVTAVMALIFWLLFLSDKIPFLLGVWGLVFSLLFCFSTMIAAFGRQSIDSERYAVLLVDASPVKSAPSQKGEDIFIIHAGMKMEILEQYEDWCKIKLANGNVGWLPLKSFEEI